MIREFRTFDSSLEQSGDLDQDIQGGIEYTVVEDEISRVDGQYRVLFRRDAEDILVATIWIKAERVTEQKLLRGLDPVVPTEAAVFDEQSIELGELLQTERTERAMLEQQADGTTTDDVIGYARIFDVFGRRDQHNRLYWNGVGLLRLRPELASAIGGAFLENSMGLRGRGFLLDILAGAGTQEAQDEVRRLLSSSVVVEGGEAIQSGTALRLGFIHRPSDAIAEFTEELYDERWNMDHHAGYSKPMAFGSLIYNLCPMNRGLAEILLKKLEQRASAVLGDESVPEGVRRAHALALGNTRAPAAMDTLREAAAISNSYIRAAVGSALSKLETEEREPVLLELAKDEVLTVQNATLRALSENALSRAGQTQLAKAVSNDSVAADNLLHALNSMMAVDGQLMQEVLLHMSRAQGRQPELSLVIRERRRQLNSVGTADGRETKYVQ